MMWKFFVLVFSVLLVLYCGFGNGSGDDIKVFFDVDLLEIVEDFKDLFKLDVE